MDKNKDITSVSVIIRNNSLGDEKLSEREPESIKQEKKVSKDTPTLPPLNIPERNPSDSFDWGESQTPVADEHMKLSPLDDHAFDSPNNSMGETQLRNELGEQHNHLETQGNKNNKEISQLEERLKKLIQQKDVVLQNPPSVEREKAVTGLLYQIFDIQQQLKQHLESQGKPPLPPSFLHQPMSSLPAMSNHPILSNNLQQTSIVSDMLNQQILSNNLQQTSGNLFQYPVAGEPILPPQQLLNTLHTITDYKMKLQQLEAIKRCLKTPSGLLDNSQIQDMQVCKEFLESQLHQENLRKEQFLQQQQQQHSSLHSMSPSINEQLSKLPEMRESVQKSDSDLSSTDFLNEYNRETEQLGKQMISSPDSITKPISASDNALRKEENSSLSTLSTESKQEQGFLVPPYETISLESKADWTTRELFNLQHQYLNHSKARFFSVLVHEYREKFMPNLIKTYKLEELLIHDIDAPIFRKIFEKPEGPIFLILRHKLLDGTWMIGGILQVLSKLQPYKTSSSNFSYRHSCRVRIVSLAMGSDLPWLRSDKSREVALNMAWRYINFVIKKLKEGKTTTVFRYQEKQIQMVCIDN